MACEVCQHCHGASSLQDRLAVRDGYSYHQKCLKCYVCSETNLLDAEVFKGVIFCRSCSQRIFQACSTARRTKTTTARTKERTSTRRRSHRSHSRRPNGILEMMGAVSPSTNSNDDSSISTDERDTKSLALSTELALQVGKGIYEDKSKKYSVEMGITTDVTHKLLMELKCPVVDKNKSIGNVERPSQNKIFHYKICSDLRIAELGASTEIANMALKHKREMPVIIKANSSDISPSGEDSEASTGMPEELKNSAYNSLQGSVKTRSYSEAMAKLRHWMDRRLGSIVKLPYSAFKRHILKKSSIVNSLMSTAGNKEILVDSIRMLLNEDITEHQRRGLRRLYSTINRNNSPHKLGWIDSVNRNDLNKRLNRRHYKRCEHFNRSQSYRCMRAHVMKMAGPTKSELSTIRERLKKLIAPSFLRNFAFNGQKAIMTSQACGNSLVGSHRASNKTLK